MKSNCHLRAWAKFVADDAEWLAFRKTKYSQCSAHSKRWYWKPLVPLGVVLQWAGSISAALGWWLRWGSWYHMIWITKDGVRHEYVPLVDKCRRFWPPVIFAGKEQDLDK